MLRVAGLVPLFEGRDSVFEGKIGFESMHCLRDAEVTIGITGFALGRGGGIEEPYWVSPNLMS